MSLKELRVELERVKAEEAILDSELADYFKSLAAPKSKRLVFDAIDLGTSVGKLEGYRPLVEAIGQDSKKLVNQVDECKQLSDRLSVVVRRLDVMQMRAMQALACTEDIMNLKDCKSKLLEALEEKNLPQAVYYLRQVHAIDTDAIKTSEDYETIEKVESETRELVKDAMNEAMEASDVNSVVALCPLLQTLGLEVEARDNFLMFMEKSVFIAVTGDEITEGVTDAATAYAQALSNVFNSTYLILQKYLAMVIQGMENSLGDILFIRKLHSKCEKEAGAVMKRFMKYRNVKTVISQLKGGSASSASAGTSTAITPSDLHVILDELTLLIQYCCYYARYMKKLCFDAESRKRSLTTSLGDIQAILGTGSNSTVTGDITRIVVFHGPTEFDKMIDELINRYYMIGEQYLLNLSVKNIFPKTLPNYNDPLYGLYIDNILLSLDECFFVIQRCGMRAIASNNVQCASAMLHIIADLLVSELAQQANEYLSKCTQKIGHIVQDHMARYVKSSTNASVSDAGTLTKGLKSAISLASSITYASSGNITGNATTGEDDNDATRDIDINEDDPYRTLGYMSAFEVIEKCIRYTERLNSDIMSSADQIFSSQVSQSSSSHSGLASASMDALSTPSNHHSKSHSFQFDHTSSEMDKMKVCKEDFISTKLSYQSLLSRGFDKIVSYVDQIFKDVLQHNLGKNGPLGGIKFDLSDDIFDDQPALALFPKCIITPLETVINVTCFGLNESNKDILIGKLADCVAERFEAFMNQTTFRFAGALRFEESIRGITNLFTRSTTATIRGKFSRLREVMVVLTSDLSSPNSLIIDNFTHLTATEVTTFLALRLDNQTDNK